MLKKKFDRGRFYTRANPKGFGYEVLQALYLNEEEQEKAEAGEYGRCRRTVLVRLRDREQAKEVFESLTLEDLGTIDNTIKDSLKERLPENDTEFNPQCLLVVSRDCNYHYLIKSYEDLEKASSDAFAKEKDNYHIEAPTDPSDMTEITDDMINNAISKSIEAAFRQERKDQERQKNNYANEKVCFDLYLKALDGDGAAAYSLLSELMEYNFTLSSFANV